MTTLYDRLDAHLAADPNSDCVVWTGAKNTKGYGRIKHRGRLLLAHRVVYERNIGPIPHGLVIDHLCRNPACCNPDHLEPVTPKENTRRGTSGKRQLARTHCPQGHPYDERNTYHARNGDRHCRACNASRRQKYVATINANRRAKYMKERAESAARIASDHAASETLRKSDWVCNSCGALFTSSGGKIIGGTCPNGRPTCPLVPA